MNTNRFITGDCREALQEIDLASVDLIYLDPPFNSGRDWGGQFTDRWRKVARERIVGSNRIGSVVTCADQSDDNKAMGSYIVYMSNRLNLMRPLLKAHGSIYLHCDTTAVHYLRLVMDIIFGKANHQAHITWKRSRSHNHELFSRMSDHILWYGAGPDPVKNLEESIVAWTQDEVDAIFTQTDHRGRYAFTRLMDRRIRKGDVSDPWRGINPRELGKRWALPREGIYARNIDKHIIPGYLKLETTQERLDALDEAGMIGWQRDGAPKLKRYHYPNQGILPSDMWTDIGMLGPGEHERTGYPTQKPTKLLNRIIKASSHEGDVVLDPFCGSGTTCVAAQTLLRRWIGIDINAEAIKVAQKRIKGITLPLFPHR